MSGTERSNNSDVDTIAIARVQKKRKSVKKSTRSYDVYSSDTDAKTNAYVQKKRKSSNKSALGKLKTSTPYTAKKQTSRSLDVSEITQQLDDSLDQSEVPCVQVQMGSLFERMTVLGNCQKQLFEGQRKMLELLENRSVSKGASQKIDVPYFVRTAVHDGYTMAVNTGMKWTTKDNGDQNRTIKPSSDENADVTQKVTEYVICVHPGISQGVIKEAIKRYFQTCKDKAHREAKGKLESFKTNMVMYQRRKRKLDARKLAIDKKTTWSEEKKEKIKKAMSIEYMSSEHEHDSGMRKYTTSENSLGGQRN